MPIGAFAERSGLTSSALRFYADSGLLHPAEVDPDSGYRHYSGDQVARATALRQLREMGMPLTAVGTVLDAGTDEACRLIDEHVAKVLGDAVAAQRAASVVKSSLGEGPGLTVAAFKGPVLADAVEQVLTASACEVGVRIEVDREAVTLTATDRYRLSTRTMVSAEPSTVMWAGTVHGEELRAAVAGLRRSALVRVAVTGHVLWLEDQHCRLLTEGFPDHRLMLASLPEVTTRVTVSKDLLLRALEAHVGERIAMRVDDQGMSVGDGLSIPAAVTGRALRISFEPTTLYPAVSTAIGPDVMLDLRGPDRPVTIRSADRGDLTTLAMPVAA
ncbi:MerR family transcriptional regulator [Streptomyces goshikiensis]|uniref:MerR family transcriptional regulator n=1 Tax=Streptomyces goshikiensis TaxID=1942 RepID=UPI003714153F